MSLLPFLVPPPTVVTSSLPESGPFYAGTSLTLRCTIETDLAVDIPYMLTVVWMRSGSMLNSTDRVSIMNVSQQSSLVYVATVTVNPLSFNVDSGIYTCSVTLDANPPSSYIQPVVNSDTETITVQSK